MISVKNTGLYFHINGTLKPTLQLVCLYTYLSVALFYITTSAGSLQRLISKDHRLIDKETNNRAEMYMSILCKFNADKGLNLAGRGSFRCRSAMSGLRYNEGVEWQEKEWRSILKRSLGKYFKQNIQENQRVVELKSKRKLDFVSLTEKKSRQSKTNTEYGPHALQPSLTEDEYQSEYSRILKTIQLQPEEIPVIERQTVGQWNNAFYRHVKRNRLTASYFGLICQRRPNTSCRNLIKTMISPSWDNEYTLYGKDKKDVARQRFIELNPEKRVQKCGIFIDNIYNNLAATPDGIVHDNSLLEVCLLKVHKSGESLLEAVESLINVPLENKNGTLQLKKNHVSDSRPA
ncbi:uncharacterized protein [Diabrotica undecimpunctata]|uniref:uncharacterized protein n=1 Tax=Diabrotica undecimpunctata TaxID=50387 RepID=UPI003B642529